MNTPQEPFSTASKSSESIRSNEKSSAGAQSPLRASESWMKALDSALSTSEDPVELSPPKQAFVQPASDSPADPSLRYKIVGILGQGGTSRLLRAWDGMLQRPVALKMLDEASLYDVIARYRFQREARILATLHHPNLVAIYDQGEQEGHPYLVMELVEGISLDKYLKFPLRNRNELLELFEQAARGVGAAHALGIVHRDLKPEHLLITPAGQVKVCDFGISMTLRTPDCLTRPGTILGTPLYMAPEQAKGASNEATPQTDVYSLGCILYEILTGRPPFKEENVIELYGKVIRDDPLRPRKVNAGLPRALEAIVEKAMSKDPGGRYHTADDLADDVRRYRDGTPVRARSTSAVARLGWSMVRKGRRLIPLAAAVILGGLSGAWGFSLVHGTSLSLTWIESQAREWERHGNAEAAYDAFRLLAQIDPGNIAAREGVRRMKALLPPSVDHSSEDRSIGAGSDHPGRHHAFGDDPL